MYFLLNMEIFYCCHSYTHRVSSIINRNHVMWRQPFVLLGSTSLILRQTLVLAVTFGTARLAQQPATIEWSVSMGCHLSIFQHFLRLLLATQDHYWKKIHANFVKPIFFLTKASFLLYTSFKPGSSQTGPRFEQKYPGMPRLLNRHPCDAEIQTSDSM